MDSVASDALELPAILERLAGFTSFDGGRAAALELRPSAEPGEVARRRAVTEEAILLLERGVAAPAGAHDVRPAVVRAGRGAVLDETDLHGVLATVDVAAEVRTQTLEQRAEAPLLADAVSTLDPGSLAAISGRLSSALDGRGGLGDTASPELGRLRRGLSQARREAADRIRALSGSLSEHLQEGFVTERAGRPVLAVKSSARSDVPGVVHDSSSSGQTLFVEPFPLVDATNRVRALEGQEREERERILAELSHEVGVHGQAIADAVAAMVGHDLALAGAMLSRAWGGCRVEDAEEVELEGARHPLIDPSMAVPIDLPLAGLRALVVSGPNAGGKTVALKTVGLFAMIAQCGLRVPARRAHMPVFGDVLSDIGDRQSIAESLSTFSAHVQALARTVAQSGPGTLVLLDEVAGGTDPREGAALARSVITELVGRGALVLASTHHWELKEWAAETAAVANAAVAVDPQTLAPRYEIELGHPGASHAFAIARRHGLPEDVVRAAEAALAGGRVGAEGLLAEASEARAAASDALARAEEERVRATAELESAGERRAELESRLAGIRAEARRERERARAEMASRLVETERELEALRRAIAAARRAEGSGGAHAASDRDRRLGDAAGAGRRARAALARTSEPARTRAAQIGDRVRDGSLGFRGRVVAIEGSVALVDGEGARVKVPLERLEVLAGDAAGEEAGGARNGIKVPPAPAGRTEIDVRGERAEAARAAVRAFVDAATPAGPEHLRVVHGRGTGALRAAVRDELRSHPLVERAESADLGEGGDGATIVWLAGG